MDENRRQARDKDGQIGGAREMERKWSGGAEPRASRRPQSLGFGPGSINGQHKYQTELEKVMGFF